jgi:hypothetical protein
VFSWRYQLAEKSGLQGFRHIDGLFQLRSFTIWPGVWRTVSGISTNNAVVFLSSIFPGHFK